MLTSCGACDEFQSDLCHLAQQQLYGNASDDRCFAEMSVDGVGEQLAPCPHFILDATRQTFEQAAQEG